MGGDTGSFRDEQIPSTQILSRGRGMNWLSRSKPLVLVVAATLGAFACGGGGGSTSSENKGTIAIGIELPESGNEASNGVPTMAGVKFAVEQQKHAEGFPP